MQEILLEGIKFWIHAYCRVRLRMMSQMGAGGHKIESPKRMDYTRYYYRKLTVFRCFTL
jgi:hypothetical protein